MMEKTAPTSTISVFTSTPTPTPVRKIAPLWHERQTTLEEERRYENLIQIHALTQAILDEIAPASNHESKNLHKMERVLRPELAHSLWLLEKIRLDQLPPDLASLVDSSSTSEFLDSLEETIWIVQATTLENALLASKDTASLLNVLEGVSWRHAKKIAEHRWPQFPSHVPLDCFHAFQDSPLSIPKGFLREGHHARACSFYWLSSPLSRPSIQRSSAILELCRLYQEFIRGYFYVLGRNLRVKMTPSTYGSLKTFKISIETDDYSSLAL